MDPKAAYKFCLKCGGTVDQHESNTKLFPCNQCGYRFYNNPGLAVSALIFDKKGRLLLIKRGINPGKGLWDLPGGFVDPGERVENALEREVMEELSVGIVSYEFVTSIADRYVYDDVNEYTVAIVFKIEVESLSELKAADDAEEYRFFELSVISKEMLAFEKVLGLVEERLRKDS